MAAGSFHSVRPTLEVGDLADALAFMTDVAGFTVQVTEGDPPTFAILGEGAAALSLVQVDGPATPQVAACYVTMTGLDDLISRLGAAGVPLEVPLTVRPWGLRDLVVRIPGNGPLIAFGEPL